MAGVVDGDLRDGPVLLGDREGLGRAEGAGRGARPGLDPVATTESRVAAVEALPDEDGVAVALDGYLGAARVLSGGREGQDRAEGAARAALPGLDPLAADRVRARPVIARPGEDGAAGIVDSDLGVAISVLPGTERVWTGPRAPAAERARAWMMFPVSSSRSQVKTALPAPLTPTWGCSHSARRPRGSGSSRGRRPRRASGPGCAHNRIRGRCRRSAPR